MAEQDAIALLKADHKKVKGLLKDLEETTDRAVKTREKLLAEIETEVKVHTQIEEEIFYPAFREAASKAEDKEMYFEATEEHKVVDFEMPRVTGLDASSEEFGARAKVLKELIEHHADEEEDSMFPKARKLMEASQLKELGMLMAERKEQLMASMNGRH
jgi:hemerythrin-like domain-containing protein